MDCLGPVASHGALIGNEKTPRRRDRFPRHCQLSLSLTWPLCNGIPFLRSEAAGYDRHPLARIEGNGNSSASIKNGKSLAANVCRSHDPAIEWSRSRKEAPLITASWSSQDAPVVALAWEHAMEHVCPGTR